MENDFTTQLARTTDWWIAYDSLNFKIRRNQLEEQLKTCETKMIRATASYGRFHYIGKWLFIVGLIGLLLWINLYTQCFTNSLGETVESVTKSSDSLIAATPITILIIVGLFLCRKGWFGKKLKTSDYDYLLNKLPKEKERLEQEIKCINEVERHCFSLKPEFTISPPSRQTRNSNTDLIFSVFHYAWMLIVKLENPSLSADELSLRCWLQMNNWSNISVYRKRGEQFLNRAKKMIDQNPEYQCREIREYINSL